MGGVIAAGAAVVAFLATAGVMTYRLWQAGRRQVRPLLTSRVLDRAGVSLAGCSDPAVLARAGAAARGCLRCRDRAACLRWLEGDESQSLRQFCPNDDLIARLRE
jgi:hypothetical protein